jgi:hypothetical protein
MQDCGTDNKDILTLSNSLWDLGPTQRFESYPAKPAHLDNEPIRVPNELESLFILRA